MPRRSPRHFRFHVLVGKSRTTVSLGDCLAGLLAMRLGEEPGTTKAGRRVRAWLQERTAEDPGGPGLNQRLIRQSLLEVADKVLSTRCAAWLGRSATAPPLDAAGKPHRTPRERGPVAPALPGRFVLYRAAPGFPPDIVARGATPEEARARAGEIYAEDDARPTVVNAPLITTEKERHGGYYVRRCSEDCWAAFTAKREIRPVPDAEGVWRTRAEWARRRKTTAWRDALRRPAPRANMDNILSKRTRPSRRQTDPRKDFAPRWSR